MPLIFKKCKRNGLLSQLTIMHATMWRRAKELTRLESGRRETIRVGNEDRRR
jgi:hypothetical protein